jgi:hypothetical protein
MALVRRIEGPSEKTDDHAALGVRHAKIVPV